MTWPVVVHSDSPDRTRAVAGGLASLCHAGDVLLLVGDLGAGKTVFAQGFAAALGVAGPVTSPTFTLVRQYRCGAGAPVATLLHADVYRTGSLPEMLDLALGELVEEDGVALIEWGEMAAPIMGADTLTVSLAVPDDPADAATARTISILGRGSWSSREVEVAGVLGPGRRRVGA
ncbi:MAG TPA: tRNA (adenosine(37)-N6)-threonylcarbamoyltransferase complex ATPase subunit type 1 TsaE [Acidimicrobiales bacterium]|nr:tRNA (adenosine(37)-N6)-threonylcarbamoyltransferase complex ATPase subunit type 1 TsaE [Acidimicrobiales bacterium]